MSATEVKLEFDPKDMPFRRLGSSGLRVPLFSLGGCTSRIWTFFPSLGSLLYVIDNQGWRWEPPLWAIPSRFVRSLLWHIRRWIELTRWPWCTYRISSRLRLTRASTCSILLRHTRLANPSWRCSYPSFPWPPLFQVVSLRLITSFRGRVIKELGLRRTDLVITTKIFWGLRKGPNDTGLSRKQCVLLFFLSDGGGGWWWGCEVLLKVPRSLWSAWGWITLMFSLRIVLTILVSAHVGVLEYLKRLMLSYSSHGGDCPCV